MPKRRKPAILDNLDSELPGEKPVKVVKKAKTEPKPLPKPARSQAEKTVKVVEKSITAPVMQGSGYAQKRLDVVLDESSASALRDLLNGLQQNDAKLSNGRTVIRSGDAVRWVLEQLTK